ncbi:MAG TPA: ROK family protein [Trebonia sp.]|jgi:predicted NBD/HSP70 family sugar kinase
MPTTTLLGRALMLIHTGQAPTRSMLTTGLGVTRATAGAVAAQLRDLGLIEIEAGPAPVPASGAQGRPSHRLAVAPAGPVAVAAQLHQDGFGVALVGLGGQVIAARSAHGPVPSDPELALRPLAEGAAALLRTSGRACAGAALAVPAAVTSAEGTAVGAHYLGWPTGTKVRTIFGSLLRDHGVGVKCEAVNDTNALALAEYRHGAGAGSKALLVLEAPRQGVGSALMLDGALYTGSTGLGMEAGHVSVNSGGLPCGCGNRGCLSVEADAARFMTLLGKSPDAGDSSTPGPLLDQAMTIIRTRYAADSGVRAAVAVLIDRLSLGLAGLINTLNPDRVLLGGLHAELLSAAPDLFRAEVAERSPWGRGAGVPIDRCVLADGVLVGAAEVAWEPVLANPALLSGPVASLPAGPAATP